MPFSVMLYHVRAIELSVLFSAMKASWLAYKYFCTLIVCHLPSCSVLLRRLVMAKSFLTDLGLWKSRRHQLQRSVFQFQYTEVVGTTPRAFGMNPRSARHLICHFPDKTPTRIVVCYVCCCRGLLINVHYFYSEVFPFQWFSCVLSFPFARHFFGCFLC